MAEDQNNYQLVSIDEFKQILDQEPYKPVQNEPTELLKDVNGLLYTDYFAQLGTNMVLSHLLVEQLFTNFEKINWALVTLNYEPHILSRIAYLYTHPLVWMTTTEDFAQKYALFGKIAEEIFDGERFDSPEFGALFGSESEEERAKWFVGNLDELTLGDESFINPETIHRWDIFSADFRNIILANIDYSDLYHLHQSYTIFDIEAFERNLQNLEKQQAYDIILLLRNEWKSIVARKLFGIKSPENDADIETFRAYLFDALQPFINNFEKEKEEKMLRGIPIPQEGNYNEVREYIELRKKYDKDFGDKIKHMNLRELSDCLSDIFKWFVNEDSLGKNLRRNK